MDCKRAKELLELCQTSEEELADPQLAPAADHLDQCPECLAAFRARQQFDRLVAHAMQAVEVPAGLGDRLHQRLAQAPSSRRAAWWRAAATVAAAAAVFVAMALWFWSPGHLPPASLQATSVGEQLAAARPEPLLPVPERLKTAELRTKWCLRRLGQLGLAARVPPQCPLTGLAGVWQATLADRPVAVLRFRDPRSPAPIDLFVLDHKSFAISGLDAGPQPVFQSGPVVVVAWSDPDFSYVAVLRGWVPEPWRSGAARPPLI